MNQENDYICFNDVNNLHMPLFNLNQEVKLILVWWLREKACHGKVMSSNKAGYYTDIKMLFSFVSEKTEISEKRGWGWPTI